MNISAFRRALPCNQKLVDMLEKHPEKLSIKNQMYKELCLEKQKIHVVVRFLFIHRKLDKNTVRIYRKRIGLIDSCIKDVRNDWHREPSKCHDHGPVKTCDFVTEAALMFVKNNGKKEKVKKWIKHSEKEINKRRSVWKKECSKKPMGKVDWNNFDQAYKRLTEWAVDECLQNQLVDLQAITKP